MLSKELVYPSNKVSLKFVIGLSREEGKVSVIDHPDMLNLITAESIDFVSSCIVVYFGAYTTPSI